jgi:competence protein ComGC
MNTQQTFQKGSYTILLSMLIGLLLISIFIFRQDLFNGGKKTKTIFEKGTDAANQAKDITQVQNQQAQETNQIIIDN